MTLLSKRSSGEVPHKSNVTRHILNTRIRYPAKFATRPTSKVYICTLHNEGTVPTVNRCVLTSVISVQQFIFILVFIQFSVNHFYFYSVLVLLTFIHFSSYLVLVHAFTIILVLIQFSFLINQIYEITVTALSPFSLIYYCSASGRHASPSSSSADFVFQL